MDIFDHLPRRVSKKLYTDKILVNDNDYKRFITECEYCELTPEVRLLDYEQVLSANRFLLRNLRPIQRIAFLIGNSDNGDRWFIEKSTSNVLFFPHHKGDPDSIADFINTKMNFSAFVASVLESRVNNTSFLSTLIL